MSAPLEDAQDALKRAEDERDSWSPDSDDTSHTSAYDDMLNECYTLPDPLNHLNVSDLVREHDAVGYRCGFNDWEDGIRGERERRQTWPEFNELCEAVEEAEALVEDEERAEEVYRETPTEESNTP